MDFHKMFGMSNAAVFILAILFQSLGRSSAQFTWVSWMYRGVAQSNNTVLAFNKFDTLNLVCRSKAGANFIFLITRSNGPPTSMSFAGTPKVLAYTTSGSVIYRDDTGIQPGFENFLLSRIQNGITSDTKFEFVYLNVLALQTADAGTYHCSGLESSSPTTLLTSGGLTINVFTTSQSRSTKSIANNAVTYSALLLGAVKLIL